MDTGKTLFAQLMDPRPRLNPCRGRPSHAGVTEFFILYQSGW